MEKSSKRKMEWETCKEFKISREDTRNHVDDVSEDLENEAEKRENDAERRKESISFFVVVVLLERK
ncbi:hypothetical protein RUM44_010845, partial [Polyplax serrata]